MVLRYLLNFILLFISNFIIAQSSELGRFTVNIKKGCIPLEVEIISENIDPSVNVVQYDFNFNTTNNVFKPSSGNSFTYSTSGKYIIAQAINQDGVEKIDFLERLEALRVPSLFSHQTFSESEIHNSSFSGIKTIPKYGFCL